MKQHLNKFIGLGALAAAAFVPAALSAQQYNPGSGVRTSPVARYNLMQLSVPTENVSQEDFRARTQAIRSCYDGKKLGEELGAEITRNRFATLSLLPEQVQEVLRDLPAGQATEVFGADESMMRVLIICSRR